MSNPRNFNSRFTLAPAIGALALVAVGCSSDPTNDPDDPENYNCEIETRSETYAAGMSKIGEGGLEFVLVASNPTPPSRGDNVWTVQVLDGSAALTDVTLGIEPFMPDHGHGTSKTATVTAGGGSEYQIDPVNLWMPGFWEVKVNASNANATDSTTFRFCVDP